jgi:hypothetical protein
MTRTLDLFRPRFPRRALAAFTIAGAIVGCGDIPDEAVYQTSGALSGPVTFTVPLLRRTAIQEYTLAAQSSLHVSSGVTINSTAQNVQAFSAGTGTTLVDPDAKLGTIVSQGPLSLRDRVKVTGTAESAGAVTSGAGVIVTGGIVQNTPLGALDNVSFSATFSSTVPADKTISSGSQTLVPGRFAGLTVMGGATAVLSAGTYYFNSLTLQSGSILSLSGSTGAVIVYVGDTVIYRATIVGTAADKRLLLAFAGSAGVFIETPFRGTVVAPQAALSVGQSGVTHSGAFFAKSVDVAANVTINQVAFDWGTFLPPKKITWTDAPVSLIGTLAADGTTKDGTSNPSTAVTFTIPGAIKVKQGNAGNGTTTLTFTTGSGTNVTCTYKGGSSEAAPMPKTSLVNWAKGKSYKLVSCSNGLTAGATTTGKNFKLHVVSGHTLGKKVMVGSQLGGGCTDSLDDPIDPVVSAQNSTSFSWPTTQPLPETDAAGHPSLYYAHIYLENKEQIRGLNMMKVLWSLRPLFAVDYARYKGKCGAFDYEGDGRGIFAYAVIPGKLYNFLRSAGIDAITNHKVMPFRAIVIPNKPDLGAPGLWNADGSMSWAVLKQNKFQYFQGPQGGLEERQSGWFLDEVVNAVEGAVEDVVGVGAEVVGDVVDATVDVVTGVGGIIIAGGGTLINYGQKLTNLWEIGAKIIEDAGAFMTGFFGLVDKFLFGSVNATIDFEFNTRDPMFPKRLNRAWGARTGQELAPTGATVWVKQWSLSLLGAFPVSFNAAMNDDGVVAMAIGKNNAPRGESGLCVELENPYGMISPFLTATEFCDFGDSAAPSSTVNSAQHVTFDDPRGNYLAQVTDGGQYNQQVLGRNPHQAEIATGIAGNSVTSMFNSSNAQTLCLDFPSTQGAMIDTLGTIVGGPAVGALASAMFQKDIFVNEDEPVQRASRAVMTHEYGHFTMCSLMFDRFPPSIAWTLQRLGEGSADARNDNVALFFESFADLFASQVAGGTNYLTPPTSGFTAPNGNGIAYCVGTPCVETNFQGINDADTRPFNDELGRFLTTYVDAFDAAGRPRFSNDPGNGDRWSFPTTPPSPLLSIALTRYLPVGNVDDEKISMPGAGWKTWVNAFVEKSSLFDVSNFMPALTTAMIAHNPNATACDLCDVYALHSQARPAGAVTQSAADRAIRQGICRAPGQIRDWLSAKPVPALPLDAVTCLPCAAGQISNANGACVACTGNQFIQANTCVSCPAGSVPNDARTACINCGSKAFVVGNLCFPCGLDQGVDLATNTCVTCPADIVINWATAQCTTQTFSTAQAPAAGDVCPGELWIEYRNIKAGLALMNNQGSPTLQSILGQAQPTPLPTTSASCQSTLAQLDGFLPSTTPGRFDRDGSRHVGPGTWSSINTPAGPLPICLYSQSARSLARAELQSLNIDSYRLMILRDTLTVGGQSTTVPQRVEVTEFCPVL